MRANEELKKKIKFCDASEEICIVNDGMWYILK